MSDQFVVAKAKMPWGSFATPTFLLCDSKGIVLKYWVGKPSAVAEEEILKALSEN
jgi:hypothetical protein